MSHLIFRVENAEGYGPYRAPRRPLTIYSYYSPDCHPAPYDDGGLCDAWSGGLRDRTSYAFGFASRRQLQQWFYDRQSNKALAEAGFCVAIYRAEDFVIGECQAIFRRDTATLISTAPLSRYGKPAPDPWE